MADIEKVIKGLKAHADGCGYRSHHCDSMECPYRYGDESCDIEEMCHDALALLKEQETEWEHLWDAPDGTFKGRCKKCGFVHFFIEGHDSQYKFCPECGRSVKWDA